MKKLLDFDGETAEYFHYDEMNDRTTIEVVQDVSGCLKRNEDKRSLADTTWKGDLHEVAAIPRVVLEQWWRELGSNPLAKENRKWFIARLNNSEWSKLRTKEGRI